MNFFSAVFARALASRDYRIYFAGQLYRWPEPGCSRSP